MQILTDRVGSIIIESSGKKWTKEKLIREVDERTKKLHHLGVKRGDRVLFMHGGSAEFFADLFSVWNLGACAACLNPESTPPEVDAIRNFIKPKLTLIRAVSSISKMAGVINLDEAIVGKNSVIESGGRIDDDALILFTSGTTGVPKGVTHTFRSILSRIAMNQSYIPIKDMKVSLCPLPTHFGHGLIGNCLTPLLSGGDLILATGGDLNFTSKLGSIIDKYSVTFMSSVPTMWKIVTKISSMPKGNTLRRIHIGSAPLSSDLWDSVIKWSKINTVFNMYGITETANWVAGFSASELSHADGIVGRMWGGNAAVYTEDKQILTQGEGEILIQSPSIMSGYYNRPELDSEVFKNGWFQTGDVGFIDLDGVIRITGRKKFEINRAGLKVNPEDIDILLERHDAVNEACAFAVPDQIAGEIVAVAVCMDDSTSISVDELQDWCSQYLVKEKVPERWFILDEIPKTDRGKINRDTVASVCLGTKR